MKSAPLEREVIEPAPIEGAGLRAMTRHQRLFAALRGDPVDRIPVSAWMHFGSEHLSADRTASLHAQFQRAYDWDFVKVMADYHFDVPAEVCAFDQLERLERIQPPTAGAQCFRMQLACLGQLHQTLGADTPIFDSGYDPYQMLLRHIGRDQADHLWTHRAWTLRFLHSLTDAICAHLENLKALGITGYFHSTNAATPAHQSRGVNDEVYAHFVRPFDLRILHAAQGLVRILHAHGSGIDLARLSGYPFEILHVADRDPANPDLRELQRWTGACVMGGIDETRFTGASRAVLKAQMDDARQQTGGRRFMLAPGCVLPSSSSKASLRFLRHALGGSLPE
jgi:uroporphyrinogen decarboxylase